MSGAANPIALSLARSDESSNGRPNVTFAGTPPLRGPPLTGMRWF